MRYFSWDQSNFAILFVLPGAAITQPPRGTRISFSGKEGEFAAMGAHSLVRDRSGERRLTTQEGESVFLATL
ncbi:hypothetical protein [Nitratidesulfovibrio sp. D1]|uniref:hypothetical protein n=1 Tax=Nitratidesulfovibrio sp. D1 TaxID=3440151 RepID=UPI003EBCAC9C